MQKTLLILLPILLATACPRHTSSETPPPEVDSVGVAPKTLQTETDTLEDTTTDEEEVIETEDSLVYAVLGHYNPGSKINNEVREMWIDLTWTPEKGMGKVELVPAMRYDKKTGRYHDIHTNEPLKEQYVYYVDAMWYLQIDAPYEVVEPLLLPFYYDTRFVYEGDLDRDGIPDFGILLQEDMSTCCPYALLTIKDGRWALMEYPYLVSFNLRASGKELARRGARKGEIIITRSDFSDSENSNCYEAPIKDSVILSTRIDAQDFFSAESNYPPHG